MGRFTDLLIREGIDPKSSVVDDSAHLQHLLPLIDNAANSTAKVHAQSIPPSGEQGFWRVDNSQLLSNSRGLKYRRSPAMEDKHKRLLETWGSVVQGVSMGDGWLRVGQLYLPMEVDGVAVLVSSEISTESEDDASNQWKTWKMPLPLKKPAVPRGTGTLYEVVYDRIVGRPAPSIAAPLQCMKSRGDTVELFGFDASMKWRLGLDDKTLHVVWWMLDHNDFGPLLRPKGKPFSVTALNPLCVAADENLVQDLQRFLDHGSDADVFDVTGRTPLMIAAERDHLDCCILLIEGGASPDLKCRAPSPYVGQTPLEIADMTASVYTQAALRAICGQEFDRAKFEEACLLHVRDDLQETAERLFEVAERERARAMTMRPGKELEKSSHRELQPRDVLENAPTAIAESTWKAQRGVLYEVVHDAVWIRQEPSLHAAKVSVRKAGNVVRLFEHDTTGNWARVEHEVYTGCVISGWMLLQHPAFGDLLKPWSSST